jgi:hypothetical protein
MVMFQARRLNLMGTSLLVALGCVSFASVMAAETAPGAAAIGDMLEEYCTKCHNFDDYAGGIDLGGLDAGNFHEDREVAEKVIRRLRAGMMPPAGEPRPGFADLQALASTMEQVVDVTAHVTPGRPGLHRLNRTEYGNAIRDLLALQIEPSDFFPADDSSRGFDNQAGALGLSPALLEAYLTAAAKISQLALGTNGTPSQTLFRVAEDANQNFRIDGLPFGTRGGIKFTHNFPTDGEYNFKTFVITLGNMGSDRPFGGINGEKLLVMIDGELVKEFDWDRDLGLARRGSVEEEEDLDGEGVSNDPLPTLDVRVPVRAGAHEIGITFRATNFAPGLDMNNDFERSTIETGGIPGFTFYPHVGSVRVDGPYNSAGVSDTPSRQRILVCNPASISEETACAGRIINELAHRAYRGKHTADDEAELMKFFRIGREQGNSFDSGIEMVLQRVLTDPKFIYRIELEPEQVAVGETYRVADLDLAARLSFFLWSSIPDDELLQLAVAGRLSEPAVLDQQLRRMLDDPRSEAMTRNFAGQWLALRNLDAHVPVVDRFPDFDNNLRQSFRRETELLFDSLIRENRPVTELLTADYTFVDERLALHYDIPGIKGERFRRVNLDGSLAVRRGILGKGSMLTVASQPGRTSPVMRGYWVLSNIIGVEPPPPPPNVPLLEETAADGKAGVRTPTLREQMEVHRDNPACLGCHNLMDPIGFALETFDATGRYRETDNGLPIDPSGQLYDGMDIVDASGLQQFLLTYEESVARNITQRMLTYALGRGMEDDDMPIVRQVQREAAKDGYRFHALLSAVVRSEAFQYNEKLGSAQVASEGRDDVKTLAGTAGGL